MEDFQIRLRSELEDLSVKVEKLEKFTETVKFSNLSATHQDLLRKQLSIMKDYQSILRTRDALLLVEDPNTTKGTY